MPIQNPSAAGSGSLPYLHALFILTDDGVTITQIEVYNDTGINFPVTWNAADVTYHITASAAITAAKTPVMFGPPFVAEGQGGEIVQVVPWSANVFQFTLSNLGGLFAYARSGTDFGLVNTALEIRIYP